MGGCNFELSSLAMVVVIQAINTTEYLDPHNAVRAQVGVAPLTWDERVEAYAQNHANNLSESCTLLHSLGPYKHGENLAWSTAPLSPAQAVNLWASEKVYYNYTNNTCREGGICRHYVQVVWRNSIYLGCASVNCKNGGTLVICNYDPPGNWVGERPY